MTARLLLIPSFLAVLAGCQSSYAATEDQTASPPASQAGALPHSSAPQFAKMACGSCHAVEEPWISPNPSSPTFAEIANKPGVTEATLERYLIDAHNYPAVMDFDLTASQSRALATYILTLQEKDYRLPPS